MKLNNKLETLFRIFEIPLQEKWENWSNSDEYTVYRYWKNLGLLSDKEYSDIFKTQQIQFNKVFGLFFKSFNYHFKPKYYKNREVADVGSGFGFITFWLVLSGASRVHTIGDPKRISFIKKLYKIAVDKGLIYDNRICFKPAFIKVGDTTLSSTIRENSLGSVLLNDTLEHITPRILPHLLISSYNNLKPGGIFISRQQNTDSKKMIKKLMFEWDKIENESYINQRLQIIINQIPDINKNDANKLAKNSRGFDKKEFYQAIKNYSVYKTIPKLKKDSPPIDITIDVPFEGNTSITRISKELKHVGFRKLKVYYDTMGSRRTRMFQPIIKWLPFIFRKINFFNETSIFVARK